MIRPEDLEAAGSVVGAELAEQRIELADLDWDKWNEEHQGEHGGGSNADPRDVSVPGREREANAAKGAWNKFAGATKAADVVTKAMAKAGKHFAGKGEIPSANADEAERIHDAAQAQLEKQGFVAKNRYKTRMENSPLDGGGDMGETGGYTRLAHPDGRTALVEYSYAIVNQQTRTDVIGGKPLFRGGAKKVERRAPGKVKVWVKKPGFGIPLSSSFARRVDLDWSKWNEEHAGGGLRAPVDRGAGAGVGVRTVSTDKEAKATMKFALGKLTAEYEAAKHEDNNDKMVRLTEKIAQKIGTIYRQPGGDTLSASASVMGWPGVSAIGKACTAKAEREYGNKPDTLTERVQAAEVVAHQAMVNGDAKKVASSFVIAHTYRALATKFRGTRVTTPQGS